MMGGQILITPRSLTALGVETSEALAPLRAAGLTLVSGPIGRQPTHIELLDLVPGCVGWIAGVERIDASILEAATDLRVISRYGVGTDAVDLAAARRHNIIVERTVGANADSVAELALLHILSGLRQVTPSARALAEGRWERSEGHELPESVVGIIGLGAVGSAVARLVTALGGTVVGHDPYVDPAALDGDPIQLVGLNELVATSQVVTLHCPAPPAGGPLIDRSLIDRMRPNTVLINTARSSLVDEAAVLDGLNSGRLGYYAVDAYGVEPPEPSPLLAHPRVVATAHLGAFTHAATRRMAELSVSNLLVHLEHQ